MLYVRTSGALRVDKDAYGWRDAAVPQGQELAGGPD